MTNAKLLVLKNKCLFKINSINKIKSFDKNYGVERYTDPKEKHLVKWKDRLFLINKELFKRKIIKNIRRQEKINIEKISFAKNILL